MNGKGDKRRPKFISNVALDANWDATFDPKPNVSESEWCAGYYTDLSKGHTYQTNTEHTSHNMPEVSDG